MTARTIDPRRIELLDPMMVEIFRAKTPAERVAMIGECNETMRLRLQGHLRTLHPDWDDAQLQREIAHRMCRDAN